MGVRDFKKCAKVAAEAHARQGWSITDWEGKPADHSFVVVLEVEGRTGVVDSKVLTSAILRRYLWERRADRAILRPTGVLITEVWGSESRMMLGAVVSPMVMERLALTQQGVIPWQSIMASPSTSKFQRT